MTDSAETMQERQRSGPDRGPRPKKAFTDPTPQRILVVASVPPPVAGQSLATEYLLTSIAGTTAVSVVDISDDVESGGRIEQIRRALRISWMPIELLMKSRLARGRKTVFYLQIGQSQGAMLRDLPLVLVARLFGWSMIGHLHGASWRKAFDNLNGPMKWIVKTSIRWFDRLIVLSPTSVHMFDGLVPGEKIQVISNAVDPALEEAARNTRVSLNETPAVLYLGNLIEGKGLQTVGEVARLAAQQDLDLDFLIAGHGQAELLGDLSTTRCRYVGPVALDEKIQVLEAADVLILLSDLSEGQPISVLEAFHFGLPVVATDTGGLPDLVDNDSGRLVGRQQPAAALRAIQEVLEPAEWSRISDHNRRSASEQFSTSRFVDEIRSVLLMRT